MLNQQKPRTLIYTLEIIIPAIIRYHFLSTIPSALPYTVRVLSGAPPLCDPAPFLSITLVGKEISTEPIRLQRLDSTSYVPGRPDTFSVQCLDIGPISRLKVTIGCSLHSTSGVCVSHSHGAISYLLWCVCVVCVCAWSH